MSIVVYGNGVAKGPAVPLLQPPALAWFWRSNAVSENRDVNYRHGYAHIFDPLGLDQS